jgi:hypothetical protein
MVEVFIWTEEVFPVYHFETHDHPDYYEFSEMVTVEQLALWRQIRDRYEEMQEDIARLHQQYQDRHLPVDLSLDPEYYEPIRD